MKLHIVFSLLLCLTLTLCQPEAQSPPFDDSSIDVLSSLKANTGAAPRLSKIIKDIVDKTNIFKVVAKAVAGKGNEFLFKAVMRGWYLGLAQNRGADYIDDSFRDWKPEKGCPLDKFKGYWKDLASAFRKFVGVVGTSPDSESLTRAIVEYSSTLEVWGDHIQEFVNVPACSAEFLRGPALIGDALIPYGAFYWSRPTFQKWLTGDRYSLFTGYQDQTWAKLLDNNSKVGSSAADDAAFMFVNEIVKGGARLTSDLFRPVIMETEAANLSGELQPSFKLLKSFYNVLVSDLGGVYKDAAATLRNPNIVDWRARKLVDIFDAATVKDYIKNETPNSFSQKMLLPGGSALKTDGKSSLPPSFLATTSEEDVEDDIDGQDSAFLSLASHVAQPSFNWLAGREQCKLDAPSDQGKCASCWAYAVTNVLDYRLCGSLLRNNLPLLGTVTVRGKTRRSGPTKLSPQVCLSCSDGGGGCKGGAPADCATYLNQRSTTTSQCWPYMSWRSLTSDECFTKTNPSKTCPVGKDNSRGNAVTALNTGYVTGIDNIKAAIASGPVTFVMATPATFLAWGGTTTTEDGVFSSGGAPPVDGAHSNHIMTAFGWGVEKDKKGEPVEFLLALNTWGAIYNPFIFEGMRFNDEVADPKTGTKGPWLKIALKDPALKIGEFPAFWLTPGVRVPPVAGKAVPVKDNWK